MPVPSSNADGFTLTEVLIAVVVLSVGLLGAAQISLGVISSNGFSKRLTVATTLAQDRLEEIQRRGYANANGLAGTETYGAIADYSAYKRVTTITANTPTAGMLTATVTVWWSSDAKSVTLQTILGE
jgi:type IV pilus modification protein PilV